MEDILEHHESIFPEESTESLAGLNAKYVRFFHIIATLNEMEEIAAAAAAEGITVQEFICIAVVDQANSAAAQCNTMIGELFAAEAQFRADASVYGG
ncbi:hypothetical protein EAE96_007129 [Botrytis aclada]|nr:hypothetical protein EAE96_007129 [Botrytis aclada]